MARLRYNGVRATLGADLLTAGTTITFTAKLTHAAGDVPNIGGTDYLPLYILDANGLPVEIVHLTAYTTGATTGTVLRAQESTTAADHSSGSAVEHGLTVADTTEFTGGGGGSTVAVQLAKRTSGDISLSTTGWQNLEPAAGTALDLVFASAQAGDVVTYAPSILVGSQNNTLAFDVATIVAGSPVNHFGTAGGASDNGVVGWYANPSVSVNITGGASYTVQAGDIDGGALRLRLRVRPANTTARTVLASAVSPLMVTATLVRA